LRKDRETLRGMTIQFRTKAESYADRPAMASLPGDRLHASALPSPLGEKVPAPPLIASLCSALLPAG
jgi:hypothetical protein